MTKTKNTTALRRAGAIGLAAATLVSGLSFGAGAAVAAPAPAPEPAETPSAAPAGTPSSSATETTTQFKVVYQVQNGNYLAFGSHSGVPNWPAGSLYSTPEQALQRAATFTYDRETGLINRADHKPYECWVFLPTRNTMEVARCNANSPAQQFVPTGSGGFFSRASTDVRLTSTLGYVGESSNYGTKFAVGAETPMVSGLQAFTGFVDSVDVPGRTADLSGYAVPGSTVLVNGKEEVTAGPDGAWSWTVLGLHLGTQPVTLEQYEGGNKTAETTVEVDLAVTPVTADISFGALPSTQATISGAAHPGAAIDILDASGTSIGAAQADPMTGTWSTELQAPNAGGTHSYTVQQVIDDEINGPIGVTADFGAAVSIVSPAEGASHNGGALSFTGRGVADGTIELRGEGSADVIGSTKVVANGTWTLRVADISDNQGAYTVTQTGKGNNVTTSQVTLNPGNVGVRQPFALSDPKDGDTVIAPDNQVTFTGTGTTGDTVDIVNTYNGRVVASTTIDEAGTWSRTGGVGFGVQDLKAVVTHAGVGTDHPLTITVAANTGVDQPFALTDPKDGDTVIAPTNQVTFTGAGTTGDSVVITNTFNGRVVATTTIGADGTWSRTGSVGFGVQDLSAAVTHGGVATAHPLTITVNRTAGVVQPYTLTAPVDGSTVVAPDNRVAFSGTGTTGARVVLTAGTGRRVVDTIVDGQGNWSATGYLSHQWYELGTSYTVPGSAPVTGKTTVTVVATDAVINPFAIQTPADGATVVAPNNLATFTGTGAAGATVELINDLGGPWERVVARATVKNDGTWTATGGLGFQTYPLAYVHTPGDLGGTPATGTTTVTVVAQ